MYGFIDVADYQKVVVTDASKGIEEAAQNYLNSNESEVVEESLVKNTIKVKEISSIVKSGNTYYYIKDENNKKYKISINVSDELPFIKAEDNITIGYYDTKQEIIEIKKLY